MVGYKLCGLGQLFRMNKKKTVKNAVAVKFDTISTSFEVQLKKR